MNERLERIKNLLDKIDNEDDAVKKFSQVEDFMEQAHWLYGQAERTEQLESENERLRESMHKAQDMLLWGDAENAIKQTYEHIEKSMYGDTE